MSQRLRDVVLLVAAGLFAGSLSGLFGIGGGTVIIPALMAVGYSQREASASSLLAIVPTCISGGDLLCLGRQNRVDPCAFDDYRYVDRCTSGNVDACATA